MIKSNNFLHIFHKVISLALLLFIYIYISAFSYAKFVSNDLYSNVLRLHIIANSDLEEDQELKLLVRDSILSYMGTFSLENYTKDELIRFANTNLTIFNEIASKTILENGYSYECNVYLDTVDFPTKYYSNITFPSGSYDSLVIEIGDAIR